ncbi:MAG TPA: peptidyl-prolyl cis-trans isomerase [Allosphingosinicella sp.]|nr:peptidyl-prolyl cis-trans isomerase [Allosphingosinicella sp.]
MISGFRKSLRSWATIALLFLALMAIVVTGFGTGGFGGLGSLSGDGSSENPTLVTVAGTPITKAQVDDEINRQYADARAQYPNLGMREFLAQGAFDALLRQLVNYQTIRQFASEQGLVATDRMIDRDIVNTEQFRNFTGQFDQATFRSLLANRNMTEGWYRDFTRTRLLQSQLIAPVAVGSRVPQGVARFYADLQLERRRGVIGVLPWQAFAAAINPTDAEIAAFYRQNQRAFTTPERRVIRYAVIGPEQTGQAGAATEAEIQRVYRANQGRFGPRDSRTIQHLVLQDRGQAEQAAQQLRGGASFADVTSRLGFAAADLTFADQTRDSFGRTAPAAVATAAFAAARGQVAGPIQAEGTFHVVRIESIATTPGRTIEQARPEIVTFIERRKRATAVDDLANRIQEQLGEGVAFEQIAREAHLTIVTTPAVTANGQPAPGAPAWQAPAELAALLGSAFQMDAEDLEPIVEPLPGNSRAALLEVQRVEPAAPSPLAQVRDRVRTALIQRRALERARAAADTIVRKVNGGTPLANAFAEVGVALPRPEAVDMVRAQIAAQGRQPAPILITFFSLPQGRAASVAAPNRAGYLIAFHSQRTAGNAASNPAALTQIRSQLGRSAPEETAQQFVRAIELRSDVQRNEEAIRRARSAASGAVE